MFLFCSSHATWLLDHVQSGWINDGEVWSGEWMNEWTDKRAHALQWCVSQALQLFRTDRRIVGGYEGSAEAVMRQCGGAIVH